MNHSISTMSGKTKVKIVFLGDQSVGKSSIIQKYIHDRFDDSSNPTVGIDFLAKNISAKGKNYRLQLWDTAGQERFRSLIPSYLKDANIALITFDVTNQRSLQQSQKWLNLYHQSRNSSDGFAFLIGNKIDLTPRQVQKNDGMRKASELGLHYYEISAKTGQNIDVLFNQILETFSNGGPSPVSNLLISAKNEIIKEEKQQDPQTTKNKDEDEKTKDKSSEVANNTIILKKEQIKNQKTKKACC